MDRYIFIIYSIEPNVGVLCRLITQGEVYNDSKVEVVPLKYYPDKEIYQHQIDTTVNSQYIPVYLSKNKDGEDVFSAVITVEDTLIDVDTDELAKLYVELNLSDLFDNDRGNIPCKED